MDAKMPLLKKYFLYTNERFPLIPIILYTFPAFYFSYFFPVVFQPTSISLLPSLAGVAVIFLVTLHLRLFDEHKDYDKDVKAHPERMLSKGIITLKELRYLLWVALALEVVLNILLGVRMLVMWAIILAWSLLMFKEFFCKHFLEKHMGLYLFSHQLLVPLMSVYGMFLQINPATLTGEQMIYVLVFAFGYMSLTTSYEIGRKTWSQDREHEFADSYTKSWGRPKTFIITQLTAIIGAGVLYFFFMKIQMGIVYFIVVGVFYLLFLLSGINFLAKPTNKNSKAIELTGMLYVFACFLSAAIGFFLRS